MELGLLILLLLILILKVLDQLLSILRHILSQLSNLILRQSDDDADVNHISNDNHTNEANNAQKIFFIVIMYERK